ncbi:MAG: substrate-binding periplasmic protein [Sphingomonadaceae bacterium]
MKKSTIVALLMLLLQHLSDTVVYAQDVEASNSDLVVLASFEYPPFMEEKPGPRPGLAVEIVREAFRRMGRPIRIDFYPLTRTSIVLDQGHADGIFTLKKTPSRELKYIYPQQAILSQDYVIFTNKDSGFKFSGDLKELADKSVGVLNKSSYGMVFDQAVEKGWFQKLEPAFNHESNFRKLVAHRMDVVICSRIVGIEILKRIGLADKIIITGPPIETAYSYLMLSKTKSHFLLASDFDKAIAAMHADGTFASIEKRYLNQSVVP